MVIYCFGFILISWSQDYLNDAYVEFAIFTLSLFHEITYPEMIRIGMILYSFSYILAIFNQIWNIYNKKERLEKYGPENYGPYDTYWLILDFCLFLIYFIMINHRLYNSYDFTFNILLNIIHDIFFLSHGLLCWMIGLHTCLFKLPSSKSKM